MNTERTNPTCRCTVCPVRDGCCFFAVPRFHALAQPRFYGKNFTLFRQGDVPDHFQKLRRGWLQLTHLTATGKAVVDFAGPGSAFGMSELMTGAPFAVTAQSMEDCELVVVEAKSYRLLLEQHPLVAGRVVESLSKQLQKAKEALYEVIGKVSPEERLLRVLEEIAKTCGVRSGTGTRIRLPLTIQNLAEKIGCSRQWTSKLIKDLQRAGLLERKSGWIVINSAGIALRTGVEERQVGSKKPSPACAIVN